MKKMLIVSILLSVILSITACGENSAKSGVYESKTISINIETENSDERGKVLQNSRFSVVATKLSEDILITEQNELVSILEKSLDSNKKVLNLMMSMDDVKKAEETGLVITVEYEDAKELYVEGAKQDLSVNRILFMMYNGGNYIVVSSQRNGSVTMSIPSNIIDKINDYLK